MDDDRRALAAALRAAAAAGWMALLVAPGCAQNFGATTAGSIKTLQTDADPNVRHLAYARLGNPRSYDDDAQRDEAARLMSKAIADGKEPVASRAVICRALGDLGRPIGREAVVRSVDDPDPTVRTEACRALGRVGRPEDATALARIMTTDTANRDCQVAAIEGLGLLKSPDPRIELALVDGMESEDPAVRLASVRALRDSTGKDLGLEAATWRKDAQGRLDPASLARAKGKDAPPDDGAIARAKGRLWTR